MRDIDPWSPHRAAQLLLALRTNPQAFRHIVALLRVRRGITWLDRHAPRGWYRNLFDPRPDGKATCRANQCMNDFSVLGMAFEAVPAYADARYVSQLTVMNRMGLTPRDTIRLGFDSPLRAYPYAPTYQELNRAWEASLRARTFSLFN